MYLLNNKENTMADEERTEIEQPKEEMPAEPEVNKEDYQAIMARLDEMAKDIAEIKAREDKKEEKDEDEEAWEY